MEKQQSPQRASSEVRSSGGAREAQKSLAAQPRADVPHRILDLRNRITDSRSVPPAAGSAGARPAPERPPRDTRSKQ